MAQILRESSPIQHRRNDIFGVPWVCRRLFLLVSNGQFGFPFGMVDVFVFDRGNVTAIPVEALVVVLMRGWRIIHRLAVMAVAIALTLTIKLANEQTSGTATHLLARPKLGALQLINCVVDTEEDDVAEFDKQLAHLNRIGFHRGSPF